MLTSVTTVLERRTQFTAGGASIPYEAGWASEGIFFIQSSEQSESIFATPEISPDGIVWTPIGEAVELRTTDPVAGIKVSHFGAWLRLRIEGPSPDRPATLLIHLTLKG